MPKFNGLEMLKKLAKEEKHTIIMLTGAITEVNSALVQCSLEDTKQVQGLATEGESGGG